MKETRRLSYKMAKRAANKTVDNAKYEPCDDLYVKLETKEGEKRTYKLAKVRDEN